MDKDKKKLANHIKKLAQQIEDFPKDSLWLAELIKTDVEEILKIK